MNLLSFIAAIVSALAWPIVALLLGFAFRAEIRALLGKMKRGKVGVAEFEFEQAIAAISQKPNELGEELKFSAAALRLATVEPRAAILGAWLEIQSEVERLVRSRHSDPPGSNALVPPSQQVVHQVLGNKPEYLDMYNDLRHLRSRAVHEVGFHPSPDSVLSYIELAGRLTAVLKSAD
jgi:hypothetical protein